jgi:hypothetical protein
MDEILIVAEHIATSVMEIQGHHFPQAMFYKDGSAVSIVMEMLNNKENIIKTIGNIVEKINADKYIIVSEVWNSNFSVLDQAVDKTAALLICLFEKDKQPIMILRHFEKTNNIIVWGKREVVCCGDMISKWNIFAAETQSIYSEQH